MLDLFHSKIDYIDSHIIVINMACDQEEYSSDDHKPQKSCFDEKQHVFLQLIISSRSLSTTTIDLFDNNK